MKRARLIALAFALALAFGANAKAQLGPGGYGTTNAASSSGSTFNPAVPGPIGGTTPAAGSFTTLSASSTVSGTGFTSTAFGAALNLSTLFSQDCTVSAAGVLTCTKAGNGTGSFQVGSLGVGNAASGTAGTATLNNFLTFNTAIAAPTSPAAPEFFWSTSNSSIGAGVNCRQTGTANNCFSVYAANGGIPLLVTAAGNVTALSTFRGTLGVGGIVANLSVYGTCNAAAEGLYGTQNDSAVACVSGVTAAAGGSTHCAMYCNGTNWVRTGL